MEIDLGAAGRLVAEASWRPGERFDSPALILLHGLEGSARSHYLLGISKKAFDAGFHTIRVNTRNCGGTEHLTPTLYSAALSQDVEVLVEHLVQQCGVGEIHACGVSLGANILLKYLGEKGEAAAFRIKAAAVLSPPIDLKRCVLQMEAPRNWIYQRYFLNRLKERMHRKRLFFPEIATPEDIDRVRTIYEFDDVITAPHFGWGTADNYYRLASSGPLLARVRVPTLIIQSVDDPLIPFCIFEKARIESNPFLHMSLTEYGGHTGFLGARPARAIDQDAYWGESRVVQFLSFLAREVR